MKAWGMTPVDMRNHLRIFDSGLLNYIKVVSIYCKYKQKHILKDWLTQQQMQERPMQWEDLGQ
jgi:hypothetical protein